MNPLIALWRFALMFLLTVVVIICSPAILVVIGPIFLITTIARRRAAVRHARYSFAAHRPGTARKSGYMTARYGMFR